MPIGPQRLVLGSVLVGDLRIALAVTILRSLSVTAFGTAPLHSRCGSGFYASSVPRGLSRLTRGGQLLGARSQDQPWDTRRIWTALPSWLSRGAYLLFRCLTTVLLLGRERGTFAGSSSAALHSGSSGGRGVAGFLRRGQFHRRRRFATFGWSLFTRSGASMTDCRGIQTL